MKKIAIDKQINSYLPQLTIKQKKAVLTVVKTFAEKQDEDEYSEEFKNELDSRYEEYINGGKLVSESEVNKKIRKIINDELK